MTEGLFDDDLAVFGRCALGPFLADFSDWIHERRRRLGEATPLLFVARDGHLPKAIHDVLHPEDRALSHYVPASRAAVAFAALTDADAVTAALKTIPRVGTVRDALLHRFHLADVEGAQPSAVVAAALADPLADAPLGVPEADALLEACVVAAREEIAARARAHLAAFRRHLDAIVGTGSMPIVVDVGYRGQTQRFFSQCLERPVAGLYLVTHEAARAVAAEVGPVEAFDGAFLPNKSRRSVVNAQRYVFEAVLSAPTGSFLHFAADGTPVFQPVRRDERSEALRRRIHEGAVRAAEDRVARRAGRAVEETRRVPLAAFLRDPAPRDAALFRGLGFDDLLMGEDALWVVAPAERRRTAHAVWIEGQAAVDRIDPASARPSIARALLARLEREVLRRHLSQGHFARWATNPRRYLAETTDPKLVAYRRILDLLRIPADPRDPVVPVGAKP